MNIILIAAVSLNRVIGFQNKLSWHLPNDLKRFRRLTQLHTVVMGRKTYESIGRPLPLRTNVVVTSNPDYPVPESVILAQNLPTLFYVIQNDPVFVIGGQSIFEQTLPLASAIYLTLVHTWCDGDAFFPIINNKEWNITDQADFLADHEHQYPYSFLTYRRVSK